MTGNISAFYDKRLLQSEQILPFEGIIGLMAYTKAVSYNPFYSAKACRIRFDIKKTAQDTGRVVSKNVILLFDDNRFVLFADGTLIYRFHTPKEAIERVLQLAYLKGLLIKKVYGSYDLRKGYSFSNIEQIVENLNNIYTDDKSFYFEKLEPQKKFIQELFAAGNICLTAAESENINPECRKYLALMADGRFLVSEEYNRLSGVKNYRKIDAFCRQHEEYVYLQREYVPQSYIDAIYRKAQEFDWFVPAEDCAEKPEISLSSEEKLQMNVFIHKLLSDNNKCLSVICPSERLYYSPDNLDYALFSDGRLLLDERRSECLKEDLLSEMKIIFPALDIRVERVPTYYISEIYKRLLTIQKSAGEIYMEILKQKAKKLKTMLNIPHHQALELSAQMSGWKNWKEVTLIDESAARFAIHSEKRNKKNAEELNCNQIEYEYKKYMQNKGK